MFLVRGRPRDGGSIARVGQQLAPVFILLAVLFWTNGAIADAVADGANEANTPSPSIPRAASLRLAQAQAPQPPSPAPANPAPPSAAPTAPAQPAASDEPIGNVATLTGTASVIRNQNTLPLKLKDDVYLNDTLVTFANSALGITFNDETTFNLTANASIKVDNYIYEDGGKQNSALFDVTKGTVAFVASSVAKTGDMKITTPTATLGIRGTTGLVEVNGAGGGAHNIKLYPDLDGRVGHIDVNDRTSGARLGSLTQASSGFTVRPGAGGRITAAPLAISPQQAARDQGIVRQVHSAQSVGRQVVSEQRALRQANPNRANPNRPNNLRNAPGPNGPQRQNNLQQRPGGQPGQGGAPNRAGQPGQPGQPAAPNRAGQQGQQPAQPAAPNRAGEEGRPQQPGSLQRQPNEPGVRQGGLPNRPPPVKRPPAPKKPPKEKKR
jgi:hypothetical protein